MRVGQDNIRNGKKGIVMTPEFFLPQIPQPVGHKSSNLVTDRKEIRDERLAKLSSYHSRILKDASPNQIHMLEFQRDIGTILRPSQEGEGDQRPITPFNIGSGRPS